MTRRPPRRARTVGDLYGHTRNRARERFEQFDLTRARYDALVKLIRAGRGVLLFRESNTRTHWLIRFNGQYGSAVYNSEGGAVSTLLDQQQLEQNLLTFGEVLAQYPLSRAITEEDLPCAEPSISSSAPTPTAATVAPVAAADLPAWARLC